MLSTTRFENTRPDGFPVLEFAATNVPNSAPRRFVPLQMSELTGTVIGPLAELRLVQTFRFRRADFSHAIEALYRFPLPGDAAVTGVTVRFGEVQIDARLAERGEAEREYETAKKEGRQAALTTRESPDVFTLHVAGIRPDEDVVVETDYVQMARPEDSARWSLRVPLTTAPRYVRADETGSRAADGQPLAVLRDPGHRFTLDLRIDGGTDIRSDTHPLDVTMEPRDAPAGERESTVRRVHLAEGAVLPDRDLTLTWSPDCGGAVQTPRLQVWLHHELSEAGHTYFLAQVAPPRQPAPDAWVARDVTLLVDHSGSMQGRKWAAAERAVTRFLAGLTEKDTIAVGIFSSSTDWWSSRPEQSSAIAVRSAQSWLSGDHVWGGTELGVALEQALHLRHRSDTARKTSRHLLIVTDAQVSDAERILRLVDEEAAQPNVWDRRRISVICIDAAPNALLATELAERSGGVVRFLTSSPADEDITEALNALLEEWAEPVYAHLRLVVNRLGGETAVGHAIVRDSRDRAESAGQTAFDVGDVPGGRVLFVCGRVPGGVTDGLTFRATLDDGREICAPMRFSPERIQWSSTENRAVRSLFGAGRVLRLEQLAASRYPGDELADRLRRLGYDTGAILSIGAPGAVYPANREAHIAACVKSLLARESLAFGIASSEAAFVATRTEKGRPVAHTAVVASAMAAGWHLGSEVAGVANVKRQRTQSLQFLYEDQEAGRLVNPGDVPARSRHRFAGVPTFRGSEAILIDSVRALGDERISQLTLTFPRRNVPSAARFDPEVFLLLYVGDMSTPWARIRLADLRRTRGVRTLHVERSAHERLRLVLVDPNGALAALTGGVPEMVVELA